MYLFQVCLLVETGAHTGELYGPLGLMPFMYIVGLSVNDFSTVRFRIVLYFYRSHGITYYYGWGSVDVHHPSCVKIFSRTTGPVFTIFNM